MIHDHELKAAQSIVSQTGCQMHTKQVGVWNVGYNAVVTCKNEFIGEFTSLQQLSYWASEWLKSMPQEPQQQHGMYQSDYNMPQSQHHRGGWFGW